ncbi:MAG: hypothetical protein WKG01_38235 [Kofleriaceae bacterium]
MDRPAAACRSSTCRARELPDGHRRSTSTTTTTTKAARATAGPLLLLDDDELRELPLLLDGA